MTAIEVETEADRAEVEALYDLCFAPGREALSSYRLRDGVPPVAPLCLVYRDYGAVAGAIRYWPIEVAGEKGLLLGPVAVHPTRQGEGLGAVLVEESLALATGWPWVILIGDAPYYSKFGFSKVSVDFPPPTNPERILARDLSGRRLAHLTGPVTKVSG
ncbi:GNAT family N-acetyltransferase [Paracoccaceae bacterium GXU_MW_L88]